MAWIRTIEEDEADGEPGDELIVSVWVDGGEAKFQTRNQDGDVVLDQGVMTFSA